MARKLLAKLVSGFQRAQVDENSVTLIQNGIPYRFTIDIQYWNLGYVGILRRENRLTGEVEIVSQDARGCSWPNPRIEKVATDGKEVYVLLDQSHGWNRIGKVVEVDGKPDIQYVDHSPHEGFQKEIYDFVVEGGKLYGVGRFTHLEQRMWFGLSGLKTYYRDEACVPVSL